MNQIDPNVLANSALNRAVATDATVQALRGVGYAILAVHSELKAIRSLMETRDQVPSPTTSEDPFTPVGDQTHPTTPEDPQGAQIDSQGSAEASIRESAQQGLGPVLWVCAKCDLTISGNPRSCPRCGWTVYRPMRYPAEENL